MKDQLPLTEARNAASRRLDHLSAPEFVALVIAEDAAVGTAVAAAAPAIARAIDTIAAALAAGGRLVYFGAGTSGRLGVLDAAECPPTFGTDPEQVLALIAGGPAAMTRAVEGAEDARDAGAADLAAIGLVAADAVVGIAASGATPYVLGGLEYAARVGAATISLSCNPDGAVSRAANVAIEVVTGPEVLSGSTRMKAGTATKQVLNMLSTGAMVRLGKTWGNLMVDLNASNRKLQARALRILCSTTGLDADAGSARLDAAAGDLKVAIASARLGIPVADARERLAQVGGRLGELLGPPD